MRFCALLFIGCFLLVSQADAQGVTRRDGFLLIWESISRAVVDYPETPFADVPEGARGFAEITYAKNRGIIDEAHNFRPDDPLKRNQALLWLYRTRNIDKLPDMQWDHLPQMAKWYPLASLEDTVYIESIDELLHLIRDLDQQLKEEVHEASYYADYFHGKGTAFGETFDMNAITAAHRTLPHNTLVRVTNLENNESVVVRINDRGPYVEGRNMDLSKAAFEAISPLSRGVIKARFERLGDPDLIDECSNERRRYQKRITREVRLNRGVPHTWDRDRQLTLASATRVFVVRGIIHPDGVEERIQDFVHPGETYKFTPLKVGDYILKIGTPFGRNREFRLSVMNCMNGGSV